MLITSLKVEISWSGERFTRPLLTMLEDVLVSNSKGEAWTIPRGFVSDGASVPPGLWSLFPPLDRYAPAALVHDRLCVWCEENSSKNARKRADKIFYGLLLDYGIRKWRAKPMYYAVRAQAKWLERKGILK